MLSKEMLSLSLIQFLGRGGKCELDFFDKFDCRFFFELDDHIYHLGY